MNSEHVSDDKENNCRPGLSGLKLQLTNPFSPRGDKRLRETIQPNSTIKMRRFTPAPARSAGFTLSDAHRLRQQVNEKEQELDLLNTNFITLRTQVESQTLNNFTMESKYLSLNNQLNDLKLHIGNLKVFEESSMRELQHKFDIQSQEMMVKHQEKLNQRKDEITAEIDKILQEKQRKYLDVVEKMNANMKSLQQKKII